MRLSGDRCQCSGAPYRGCGEFFNSTHAFAKHRTGEATARRCLSIIEMEALGMARNKAGYWVSALRDPDAAGVSDNVVSASTLPSATPPAQSVTHTSAGGSLAVMESCPKFDGCSATICPGDDWQKRQHLASERVCLYMRELSKPGGPERVAPLLPSPLFQRVQRAHRELTCDSATFPPDRGFGDLRKALLQAAHYGSSLERGKRLAESA